MAVNDLVLVFEIVHGSAAVLLNGVTGIEMTRTKIVIVSSRVFF